MNDGVGIFDRRLVRRNRARAASAFGAHDFLFREAGARLIERLGDVNRDFQHALLLGGRTPMPPEWRSGKGQVARTTAMELTPDYPHLDLVADEEALPFGDGVFDLVLSPLSLHWVNDLPGALIQLRRALKPDGLLLAALFGGGTLSELRQSLMAAELEVEGGVSPRVAPFADIRDAGGLLQRAGLALPVADLDRITVTYDHPLKLLAELRGMGEQNATQARRRSFLRRETLTRAMAIYQERFSEPDGRVRASFEVIYLIGWAPHDSQPKPLRPGATRKRLAEALGAVEKGAGEKAG